MPVVIAITQCHMPVVTAITMSYAVTAFYSHVRRVCLQHLLKNSAQFCHEW